MEEHLRNLADSLGECSRFVSQALACSDQLIDQHLGEPMNFLTQLLFDKFERKNTGSFLRGASL